MEEWKSGMVEDWNFGYPETTNRQLATADW